MRQKELMLGSHFLAPLILLVFLHMSVTIVLRMLKNIKVIGRRKRRAETSPQSSSLVA